MPGIFHRKTPQEIMREQQRLVNRSIREIDRERMQLQQQEKKTIIEIKKMARQGQVPAAKILAKQLVQTRKSITKLYTMRAQMQTVQTQLTTMKSSAAMTEAMAGATKAMRKMNKKMNLPGMQQIMMEFEKQSEMMGMKQEMIDDTLEELDEDEDDEESEEVINQTLEEIGIDLEGKLVDVPTQKATGQRAPAQKKKTAVAEGGAAPRRAAAPKDEDEEPADEEGGDDLDEELEARLNALKK